MDVIREYLIALGWKIDEGSWKRFQDAVAMTTKVTGEIGSVALETATAIELMVARVARQYESLYYVSQRTYQSVGFLQASQFGFQQIGMSAGQAIGSIESVAASLRQNPWLASLFGGARTPQKIADALQDSGLPYFVQARLAGLVGLDEQTLFHLERFGAIEEKAQTDLARREKEAGINPDQAALKFTAFSRELNKFESDLGFLETRIALDWVKPVKDGIGALDEAVQWLNRADAATKGWIDTLGSLATTALGAFLGNKVVVALLRTIGILPQKGVGAAASGAGTAAEGAAETASGSWLGAVGGYVAGPLGFLLGSTEPAGESDAAERARRERAEGATPQTAARLNEAVAFFRHHGYSAHAAEGIATSLFFESGQTFNPQAFNPAGGGHGAIGIGQWRGERADQFRKLFGHDLSHASFKEELEFVLWEMHEGTDLGARRAGKLLANPHISASRAAETFIGLYERPGPAGANEISDAADFAAGLSRDAANVHVDRSVTVHSKTDIHLVGDAKNAAAKVAVAADQANGTLVRNLQGAVR